MNTSSWCIKGLRPIKLWLLIGMFYLGASDVAPARVKLVAIPERANLSVSFTHPSAVLVQESRVLTLQEGINKVDFSWQAVSIQPESIQIHILNPGKGVEVLNTSYPPGEAALVWELFSSEAREAQVRITYLLHRISKEDYYQATVARDEKTLELRRYVRLINNSGEDFSLVDLIWSGSDVNGTSLANGEILDKLADVPSRVSVNKKLVWDAALMPWDAEHLDSTPGLPLYYILSNSISSGLGNYSLPGGKIRVFMETSDSVAFGGENTMALTPVNRELAITIGKSREVKVTQRKIMDERINIRRNPNNVMVLWDTEEQLAVEVENFKKEPVNVTLVQHIPGYWKVRDSSHPHRRKDAFTIEFDLVLKPESKESIQFSYQRLNVQSENEGYIIQ